MTLDGLTKIILEDEGQYKFLLMEIGKEASPHQIIVGYKQAVYHPDIVRIYTSYFETTYLHVLGGGRVTVNSASLLLYGTSICYGTAPQEIVEEVVSEYNKPVVVDMGVTFPQFIKHAVLDAISMPRWCYQTLKRRRAVT